MSNTFNLNRFALLLGKQWIEYRKVYLMCVFILAGVLCMVYTFHLIGGPKTYYGTLEQNLYYYSRLDFRQNIFSMAGGIFLSLLAGHYFANLGNKAKATQELTLPISKLEKVMCAVLLGVLLTTITYAVVFSLVDAAFINILKSIYSTIKIEPNKQWGDNKDVGFKYFATLFNKTDISMYASIGFIISNWFLLGSIYFNRFAYIKTATAGVSIIAIIIFTGQTLQNFTKKNRVLINANENSLNKDSVILIIFAFISITLWLITFYRLKEKEV